jgi:hypothetical protein
MINLGGGSQGLFGTAILITKQTGEGKLSTGQY